MLSLLLYLFVMNLKSYKVMLLYEFETYLILSLK